MTYTAHRYTQQTLSILETLDTDVINLGDDELARRFGYEEELVLNFFFFALFI